MAKKKVFAGHSKYFTAVEGRKHNVDYGGGVVIKGVRGYTVKPRKRKLTRQEKEAVRSVYMREYGDFVNVAAARKRARELDKEVHREKERRKLRSMS